MDLIMQQILQSKLIGRPLAVVVPKMEIFLHPVISHTMMPKHLGAYHMSVQPWCLFLGVTGVKFPMPPMKPCDPSLINNIEQSNMKVLTTCFIAEYRSVLEYCDVVVIMVRFSYSVIMMV